ARNQVQKETVVPGNSVPRIMVLTMVESLLGHNRPRMTGATGDQSELADFLKARRAELAPSDFGLPDGGTHRRVTGLRREEVAQFAAISTDYYTRLEQGRISPSAPVLESLARVLQLTDDQRTYMYELAGTNVASARSRRRTRQKVKPFMQRLLDHITDTPAIVMT